ncbi:restriction endonuclease subunit S [Arthrobacter sp. PAMC25564]|uniref:restriction endonuclease subunit S n=1 Tax=Arthrobacter sp. PAMC25564 TaxID=2565366 RepID=UPI0010A2797F|nr:restriction endonuclease subunit S [Arthrobacter sp. PAMC25564]QCB97350.1 restriction endonuclease subunit S [Arthrobacter sp. PAMC25564]
MNGWRFSPLVDLVQERQISYGVVQPGNDSATGIPIVRVKDVRNGIIDTSSPMRVAEEISRAHSRTTLVGGELLLTLVGTVGESAVVPESLAGWNVARAIAVIRPEGVSSRWLQLCFESPKTIESIRGVLNTTVQATLNLSDLKQIPIPIPPEPIRLGIEEVVRALDDKIAANTTLAGTAEKLAATEFHRRVGHLPFSQQAFGDLAKVSGGGTPSTSIPEFWSGDVLWATPTDVTALKGPYLSATSRRISDAGLAACASELYPPGAILMTSRATIGAFALAQEPMAVNQGFIVVQPHDPDLRFWFFHEMRSRVEEFISLANGATFLELSRGNFKKFKVRLAEPHVMEQFVALAEPLHAAAANALSENAKLAATRDALLPQLMSGKLRVKDAEALVAAAV